MAFSTSSSSGTLPVSIECARKNLGVSQGVAGFVLPVGATINLGFIWLVADTLNAMMALPNLIALLLLSPVVFKLTREHFDKQKALGVE